MAEATAATQEELARLVGFDQPRVFCNTFGALKNPILFVLIAKETLAQEGSSVPALERNVGSWIIPLDAAEKLRDLLLENFPLQPK